MGTRVHLVGIHSLDKIRILVSLPFSVTVILLTLHEVKKYACILGFTNVGGGFCTFWTSQIKLQ